jgi:hypothetical protein
VPRRLWTRLNDRWTEIARYRHLEIELRRLEFAAILEQEEALLVHARKLINLANANDPLAQPDSPLTSSRARYYRRRQEMRLREPQAALALSILFPTASR